MSEPYMVLFKPAEDEFTVFTDTVLWCLATYTVTAGYLAKLVSSDLYLGVDLCISQLDIYIFCTHEEKAFLVVYIWNKALESKYFWIKLHKETRPRDNSY